MFYAHFAARFAAKEAMRKAMGEGPDLNWQDVEVIRSEHGPVSIKVHGVAAEVYAKMGVQRCFLTLSHEHIAAVATVILEG